MNSKTVLICDDDRAIVHLCNLILSKNNYNVEVCYECESVLAKMATVMPDIILLDLWLPAMGGKQLFSLIRTEPDYRNIPIILFSANNDIEKIAEQVKADGFLKKPFDIKKMTAIIEEHLPSGYR